MTSYNPERAWPRLVPKGALTVSIFGPDGTHAYGIVTNVSLGGCEFVAGVGFGAGQSVLLRLGFDPEHPFSTSAKVVWSRDDSNEKQRASFVHGARFVITDPEQVERLGTILESREFEQPVAPRQPVVAGSQND